MNEKIKAVEHHEVILPCFKCQTDQIHIHRGGSHYVFCVNCGEYEVALESPFDLLHRRINLLEEKMKSLSDKQESLSRSRDE